MLQLKRNLSFEFYGSFCFQSPSDVEVECVYNLLEKNIMAILSVLHNLQTSKLDIVQGNIHSAWNLCLSNQNQRRKSEILVSLTVFQTGQFDVHAAEAVVPESYRENMVTDLNNLHCDLWLEADRLYVSCSEGQNGQPKLFSLHQTVLNYFQTRCESDLCLKNTLQEAERRFIRHMYDEIVQERREKNPSILLRNLQLKLVHLRRFFHLVSKGEYSLLDALPQDRGRFVQLKSIWLVAQNILTKTDLIEFAERQKLVADKGKDVYLRVYFAAWMADSFLDNCQNHLALDVIEKGKKLYKDVAKNVEPWFKQPEDEHPARYWLSSVELKVKYFANFPPNELEELVNSCMAKLEKLKKGAIPKTYHELEKFELANRKGRILFKSRKFDKAIEWHKKALEISENPINLLTRIECMANLAHVYTSRGIKDNEEAMKFLDRCINSDNPFVKENPAYPINMQSRAELHYYLKNDNLALEDGRKALEIVRRMKLPMVEVANAISKVAKYEWILGKDLNVEKSKLSICVNNVHVHVIILFLHVVSWQRCQEFN